MFYDKDHRAELLGAPLYEILSDVYSTRATLAVMLVSRSYASKAWTNHERRAMQARAFHEHEGYILPVRLDDTKIPGLLPTTGYESWPPHNADTLADLIVEKMNLKRGQPKTLSRSGIEVFCDSTFPRRPLVSIGILPVPRCRVDRQYVDRQYEVVLKWNEFAFVPLEPAQRHRLEFFVKAYGFLPTLVAELDCLVRGAEVLKYKYKPHLTIFGRPLLKRIGE